MIASALVVNAPIHASEASPRRVSLPEVGAVSDGSTVNTEAIQAAIDRLGDSGGGTLVVPKGTFLSGALFFKPGVNLHLEKEGVLKASNDMTHFPVRPTRIEGQILDFNPALVNAEGCDGFRLTGEGNLDGNGRKIWDEFWKRRNASSEKENFKNLSVPRARIALITNSRGVLVEGVTFKDSQYWNLHLYLCREVLVRNARFVVPDDYKQAPSTDGIDVDSCQDVSIGGCYFSVTDDAIAMKGTKGPAALEDKSSPPVERVRISDCTFRRAHAALTLGSEATVVRDVVAENCRVTGDMTVLNLKLRPDTPQHYEDIHIRNFTLENDRGRLVAISPWRQYFDLKGQQPPQSVVRNISVSGVTGRYGGFGRIEGNKGQTTIQDIFFKDITLSLQDDKLKTRGVQNLRMENVILNETSR